ncbi:hypothetical protein [Nonomuraea sp. 10N515B]|uniref:hypothetical protein n=1 Tax=Nonomuraea sp. 10N515B TaxID=3457422 RepID=UPI003FCD20CD
MVATAPLLARFRHPGQVVDTGFGLVIGIGTALLSLPVATTEGESAGWVTALFTAASAVCVTGLALVHYELPEERVIVG